MRVKKAGINECLKGKYKNFLKSWAEARHTTVAHVEAVSDIDFLTDLLVNQISMNQSYPPPKNIQLLSSQKTKS